MKNETPEEIQMAMYKLGSEGKAYAIQQGYAKAADVREHDEELADALDNAKAALDALDVVIRQKNYDDFYG